VKLAHIADPHLGIRQYHRQTPAGINQREADVAHAFRLAVDAVIAARPDAVVVAGDLFHSVRPTNAAIVFAFRQFQRLREALPGAPVVLIAGNHDTPRSTETGSILRLFEELGVDVATDEARRLVYPALDLSVLAVPHQALVGGVRPSLRPDGTERHRVLLLHGEVEGVFPFDRSAAEYGGALLGL
jgi:DNA repair protein SbcD/Mre11